MTCLQKKQIFYFLFLVPHFFISPPLTPQKMPKLFKTKNAEHEGIGLNAAFGLIAAELGHYLRLATPEEADLMPTMHLKDVIVILNLQTTPTFRTQIVKYVLDATYKHWNKYVIPISYDYFKLLYQLDGEEDGEMKDRPLFLSRWVRMIQGREKSLSLARAIKEARDEQASTPPIMYMDELGELSNKEDDSIVNIDIVRVLE